MKLSRYQCHDTKHKKTLLLLYYYSDVTIKLKDTIYKNILVNFRDLVGPRSRIYIYLSIWKERHIKGHHTLKGKIDHNAYRYCEDINGE